MSTINFSIPDRVKEEFNTYYAEENKSAVLTSLVEEAIERKKRQERRAKAIEAILEYRKTAPRISNEEVYRIRQESRE